MLAEPLETSSTIVPGRRTAMTLMLICRLTHCPGYGQATVVLEDMARRLQLAFLIPINEAHRLARILGISPCPRVPVLELIDGLLTHFKARVLRVVLDGDDVEISGTLYIRGNDGETTMPCHPADGLALAEQASAPIYATDQVLRHACPLGRPHHHGIGLPHAMYGPERVRPENFYAHQQGRH
jgi:bifunctional DNase/RNase